MASDLFSYTDSEGDMTVVNRFDDGVLVNASSGGGFVPPDIIPNLIDALRSVEDEDWPTPDRNAADRRAAAEAVKRETGSVPLTLRVAWILRKHVGRGSYIPSTEAYVAAEDIVAAAREHIEAEVRADEGLKFARQLKGYRAAVERSVRKRIATEQRAVGASWPNPDDLTPGEYFARIAEGGGRG